MASLDVGSVAQILVLIVLICVIPVTAFVRLALMKRAERMLASDDISQRSLHALLFWKKILDKLVVACFVVVIGMVLWGLLIVL